MPHPPKSRRRRSGRSRSPGTASPPGAATPAAKAAGRRRGRWLAASLAGAGTAAALILWRLGGGVEAPDPPNPDLTEAEPAVAEAIRRARNGVLEDRGSPDRWAGLGAALLVHELHPEAAAAYRAANLLAGGDYRWSYLLARSRWRVDPAAAEEAALAAVRENPDYAPAQLLAGQLAEERGDLETAAGRYRSLLDQLGEHRAAPANEAAARFRLGRLLAGAGDLEAALPLLERAETLAPESGAVAAALARLYRRTGSEAKARAAANRARGLDQELAISDPLMETVHRASASVVGKERRAFAAEAAGRPEVAERLLREMIQTRPEAADLYYNLGNNLSRQGRNPEALEAWRAALSRNPDHVAALVNSAIVLAQTGDLEEAERRCRRVLELRPDHPGALSSLGSIAALGGRRVEAVGWFRQALEQEPERAGTHDSIAQVLAADRRFDQAVRHFRIAVTKEPFRGDYRLGLAASLAALGDFAGAWTVTHAGRRLGVELPEDFLGRLRQAMPDPGPR